MAAQAIAVESGLNWQIGRRVALRAGALEYSGRCRQLHELGGDCFNVALLDEDRTAFTIGDGSGKGLSAALLISSVQSSLRNAEFFSGAEPAEVIEAVNRQVYASSAAEEYATFFYGVYDAAARTLRYVNAGQNPPMVLRRGGSVEWLRAGGRPVGMFEDSTYEEGAVRLDPGDLLVACTDGVTEAANPHDEQWGLHGLRRATAANGTESPDAIVDAIFTAIDEFSHRRRSDDETVLVLRVQ